MGKEARDDVNFASMPIYSLSSTEASHRYCALPVQQHQIAAELRIKIAEIGEWGAELRGSAFDRSNWIGGDGVERSWMGFVDDIEHELHVPISVRKAEANAWITEFSNWFNDHISRYSQQYPDCAFHYIVDPKYFIVDGNGGYFSDRNRPQTILGVDKRREIVENIRSTAQEIKLYHQIRETADISLGLSEYITEEKRITNGVLEVTKYIHSYFETMSEELSLLNGHKEGPWKSTSAAKVEFYAYRALARVARAMDKYYEQIAELETQRSRQATTMANAARKADHTFCILAILARHRHYKALKRFNSRKDRPNPRA